MLLIIGLVLGLVLGLTGAGGSVFAVPLLIIVGGLDVGDAVGVSLGAIAVSTVYGSFRNWFGKNILWMPGVIFALSGAIFAPLGKYFGSQLSDGLLIAGFNFLAIIIAFRMWLNAQRSPNESIIVRAGKINHEPILSTTCALSKSGQFELRPRCVAGLSLSGMVVGVLSGMFGVGGGFLIVPLLLALSSISMAQAVSTSLIIIAAISSSGFLSYLFMNEHVTWMPLALVASGGAMGMMLGQLVSHKVADVRLQKIFAICLIAISTTAFLRYFFHDPIFA